MGISADTGPLRLLLLGWYVFRVSGAVPVSAGPVLSAGFEANVAILNLRISKQISHVFLPFLAIDVRTVFAVLFLVMLPAVFCADEGAGHFLSGNGVRGVSIDVSAPATVTHPFVHLGCPIFHHSEFGHTP